MVVEVFVLFVCNASEFDGIIYTIIVLRKIILEEEIQKVVWCFDF